MHEPSLKQIEDKLKDIYDDLADNVTNIYYRQDLHLILDLVYHSPLRFKYDRKLVHKGYPEVLIVGDTRCLGGETLIYDPITKISTPVSEIKEDFHVHAWDGQRLVETKAERPFKKDIDKLYTVTLSTGDSFVCSKSHVVLTPSGWRAIGQLQVGCAVFHPQSIADTCLLARAVDEQHLTQRVGGSQSDCPACFHSHDEQPRLLGDTFLKTLPLQDDAQSHMPVGACVHMDAKEREQEYTHQDQSDVLLSSKGGLRLSDIHTDKQYHSSLEPCASTVDQVQASQLSMAVSVPPSPIPEVALLDNEFYSLLPYDAPFVVITSIVYKRDDVKWDFTVPIYHNYLCGGVIHHNTGKTQCAEALQNHYGVGITAGGEGCTFAGLVGGLQQVGSTWTTTWGKIPQNNRRLVIIDEAGGIPEADIAKMSSLRSQGKAEIVKIQSQRTEAWTRLIWLANPKYSMTINEFSSGIDAVESIISFPEDIARWDAIMIVSKDEVPFARMASRDRVGVPHKYTKDLSKNLVLWAWTREVKEIELTEGAEDACFELGDAMCNKYCSDFTLVNDAEQRIKLARLATALAARLYSTPDGKKLIVQKNHVVYIHEFLTRIYDSKYFRFDQWSINQKAGSKIVNEEDVINFCKEIGKWGCGKFHEQRSMTLQDIENYLGVSHDEAKSKLSKLLLSNAMSRGYKNTYKKSPDFNALLAKYAETLPEKTDKEF